MRRTFVLAVPALLLTVSLAPAQSYSSGGVAPDLPPPAVRPQPLRNLRTERDVERRSSMDAPRNLSPDDLLSALLSSPEYYREAGGTDAGYVARLYADLLRRPPLPAELRYQTGRLRTETRKDFVDRFLRFHPQRTEGIRETHFGYDPDDFPDPNSPRFRDPSGPYFHSPYFNNYEKRRSIRAFSLSAQG